MILAAALVLHIASETLDDATKGTRDEWVTSALQRTEVVDHVHDRSVTVLDRDHGWLRDWNGHVQPLEADDLRMQIDLAALHTLQLHGDPIGEDAKAHCRNVRVHPQNGDVFTVCLDDATALPQRAELPAFDGTLTIAFSDWREVNGSQVSVRRKAD